MDDKNSSNFDAENTLKNQVGDSDINVILIYESHEIEVDSLLNIAKIDGEKQDEVTGGNIKISISYYFNSPTEIYLFNVEGSTNWKNPTIYKIEGIR